MCSSQIGLPIFHFPKTFPWAHCCELSFPAPSSSPPWTEIYSSAPVPCIQTQALWGQSIWFTFEALLETNRVLLLIHHPPLSPTYTHTHTLLPTPLQCSIKDGKTVHACSERGWGPWAPWKLKSGLLTLDMHSFKESMIQWLKYYIWRFQNFHGK